HPLGTVPLKATSSETGLYTKAERSVNLVVLSRTLMQVAEKKAFKGPVSLEAQLLDDGGFPVPDVPVTLSVAGIPSATVLTDRSGLASTVYAIAQTQPAGALSITARFEGGALLEASRGTGTLFVLANTNLTLNDVSSLIRGELATLQGTLREDSGHPVPSGEVVVKLAGREIGRAGVDGGLWTLNARVPEAIPAGPVRLDVVFEKTNVLQASSLTSVVTVKDKARLKLVEVPTVATADASAKVQLTDSRGRGVGNVTLSVALGGRTFQVRTDATGNATFPVVAYGNDTERLPVQVRFAGDDGLTAASAKANVALRLTTEVEPTVARTSALVGLVVALLLIGALGAFLLLRRRAAEEARAILQEAEQGIVAGDEVRAVLYLAYRKLRATLAKQGHLEGKADTMREFLRGLEQILPVDPAALGRLSGLLEVARYTDRPFGENARKDALDVLRRIDRDLTRSLGKGSGTAAAPKGGEEA
ncbi:MAG TPA: DUF4129 domain-containing protein, partial [Candidatus Thermoplasmatota archaeon]|nr:DUF4129 domain-containing protein [Candidatus Thermoplasmatota archaeon]